MHPYALINRFLTRIKNTVTKNRLSVQNFDSKIFTMIITKFITGGLLLMVVSCTISKPIISNNISENKQQRLEANKKRKAIQSDLEIMKGWTEAEKQYFIDNFVYKRIEIRNDTLVFIK
jgi:hypothetical protein